MQRGTTIDVADNEELSETTPNIEQKFPLSLKKSKAFTTTEINIKFPLEPMKSEADSSDDSQTIKRMDSPTCRKKKFLVSKKTLKAARFTGKNIFESLQKVEQYYLLNKVGFNLKIIFMPRRRFSRRILLLLQKW